MIPSTDFPSQYEAAISKDRGSDPQILACLGRVYLLKGKQEKSVSAMKTSLEYSRRALLVAPDQIHIKFNIAFVQFQLAQLIYSIPDHQRSLSEVESAASGLDEAIESMSEIAKAKNAPFPRHDLEQRANMGRNTIRKQLDRAIQSQRDYEEANATKLAKAREIRDAEVRAKEERQRKAEEEAAERKRKLQEERQKLIEKSREMAEKRAEMERAKDDAEWTEGSDGERVKRKKRPRAPGGGKRKKKEDGTGDESSANDSAAPAPRRRGKKGAQGSGESGADEARAPRKKRRLARKSEKANSKFKSAEMVVDSDEDIGDAGKGDESSDAGDQGPDLDTEMRDVDEGSDEDVSGKRKGGRKGRIVDSDEEDESMDEGANGKAAVDSDDE